MIRTGLAPQATPTRRPRTSTRPAIHRRTHPGSRNRVFWGGIILALAGPPLEPVHIGERRRGALLKGSPLQSGDVFPRLHLFVQTYAPTIGPCAVPGQEPN